MEFKPEIYKRACSRLVAPPDKLQEVIEMTEKQRKPKRIVRTLLVAAAMMALAVLGAMGANAASGGELFEGTIFATVWKTDDGEEVSITINGEKAEDLPDVMAFSISEGEDGKAYLTYIDKDGKRVTEEVDNIEEKANSATVPGGDVETETAPSANNK